MNEKELKIVMTVPLRFSLTDEKRKAQRQGTGKASIDQKNLSILPDAGDAILVSWRDVIDISLKDYSIRMVLAGGEIVELAELGFQYEDFTRELFSQRNQVLLEDMLMDEKLRNNCGKAHCVLFDPSGTEKMQGEANLRLYDTALVILPMLHMDRQIKSADSGGSFVLLELFEPLRIPFGEMADIKVNDYCLTIQDREGTRVILSMMGERFEPFCKSLTAATNELSLLTHSWLKEMLADADISTIGGLGRLLVDGRAAKKNAVDAVYQPCWERLEKKFVDCGLAAEYKFLKSLSRLDYMAIGLKKGLLGELSGDLIWTLAPILSAQNGKIGNAVAFEAGKISLADKEDNNDAMVEDNDENEDRPGRATYFFRIAGRREYPQLKDTPDFLKKADDFMALLNRCLRTVNFRREPIYLSAEKLQEDRYRRYFYALRRLPDLRFLRQAFIGRVMHGSFEQWQQDLLELLEFNVQAGSDERVWQKKRSSDVKI